MNRSKFNQTGGYPLKTERLQEQEMAYSIFNAFGALAGDLTIISGCEIIGTTVKDGFVFIAGELYQFKSAAFTSTSTVVIIETPVNRSFKNGVVKEVCTIRHATFGTSEVSWLWSDFKRPIETKILEAFISNVSNRLTNIETKLDGIEDGAQKNVQSDWDVTDELSSAFIKNKISITSPFLRKDVFNIGNVGSSGNVNDTKMTVSFPTVGTSNYMVLGALKGRSGFWNDDNDVFWSYGNEQTTSFEIYLREILNNTQDLKFYYVLIPLS